MQIIKLAAGQKRKIRITTDEQTGELRIEVVDNPTGVGCNSGANMEFIKKFMQMDMPEYGSPPTLAGSGLTEEGFAAKMTNRTNPLSYTPDKEKQTKYTIPQAEEEGKKIDTGFSV
jgi:hypothetical protein